MNTGWSGGPFGVGKLMKLAYTRSIVDSIHAGHLKDVPTVEDEVFGFAVPTECPDVPADILIPKNTWSNPSEYDKQRVRLANLFTCNFEGYADQAGEDILNAGPRTVVAESV